MATHPETASRNRLRRQIDDLRQRIRDEQFDSSMRVSRMRDELNELVDLYEDLTT
jgi:hypothetical protein